MKCFLKVLYMSRLYVELLPLYVELITQYVELLSLCGELIAPAAEAGGYTGTARLTRQYKLSASSRRHNAYCHRLAHCSPEIAP